MNWMMKLVLVEEILHPKNDSTNQKWRSQFALGVNQYEMFELRLGSGLGRRVFSAHGGQSSNGVSGWR
jgi:hypothetical protein